MTRISALVLALGTVGLLLAGCGGQDESTEASGLRKGSSATSVSASSSAVRPTGAPTSVITPDPNPPSTTKKPIDPSLGPASRTTCGDFRKLDTTGEKTLIEQILAENPGGPFEGSPNVALGTAKLVCLAPSVADTPVAVAAGLVAK